MDIKLNDTNLQRLKRNPPPTDISVKDGHVGGLELRISKSATMSWSLRYRVSGDGRIGKRGRAMAGMQKRLKIGRYPAIGIKAARATARNYLVEAERGEDPSATLKKHDVDNQPNTYLIRDLLERFFKDYAPNNLRKTTRYNANAQLQAHVIPRWGNLPVSEITKPTAAKLLLTVSVKDEKTGRGGPAAAADVRKWMHRIYSWAEEQGFVEQNPFRMLRNPEKLKSRDRVLSMDELRSIWRGASKLGYPWGPAFQLLILTGCRRSEWLAMRWRWVDLSSSQIEWPSEHYKSGRSHSIPLTKRMKPILEKLPRWNGGDYLFSTTGGEKPVSSFSKAKKKLDATIALENELEHWTIHDIRRSVATHMARIGVDEIVIERLLGHSIPGVKGIYNRYRYFDEVLDALTKWETELSI